MDQSRSESSGISRCDFNEIDSNHTFNVHFILFLILTHHKLLLKIIFILSPLLLLISADILII